jgi:hypothetical protein
MELHGRTPVDAREKIDESSTLQTPTDRRLPLRSCWHLWPAHRALRRSTAIKPNILFIMGDDIGWMQPASTIAA